MASYIKYLVSVALTLTLELSFAQCSGIYMYPNGADESWGTGALRLNLDSKIPVYDVDSESLAGYLIRNTGATMILDKSGSDVNALNYNAQTGISHISRSLIKAKKYNGEDAFLVNWQDANKPYIVYRKHLTQLNSHYYTYKDILSSYLIQKTIYSNIQEVKMGVNIKKSCINLRSAPTVKSEKILCVLGNDWKSGNKIWMSIINTKNNWAYVRVQLLSLDDELNSIEDYHECLQFKIDKEYLGWVKMVDDSGFPNIWYSVSHSGY